MRGLRYPRLILEWLGFSRPIPLQVLTSSCLAQEIFSFPNSFRKKPIPTRITPERVIMTVSDLICHVAKMKGGRSENTICNIVRVFMFQQRFSE